MSTATPSPRLVLIDGHGIIHRAYWAQRDNPLTVRRTGEIVTAVYGFTNTLLKVLGELQPSHIAVTMDRAGPTFRHLKDETYKAHRPPLPEDLIAQFARVEELVSAFNIPIYAVDGYEADDVLAALAHQAKRQHVETYLITLDSDILQLVEPGIRVYMYRIFQRDVVDYDEDGVQERYGLRPAQIPDLKALKGDTSDNIPGVPGIGEKTAVKLLQAYGDVDGVYAHLEEVTPPRLRELLREHEPIARHSHEMATIVDDAPVTLDLDACVTADYDRERVLALFRELEFRSLIDRLPASGREEAVATAPADSAPMDVRYEVIDTLEALDALVVRMRAAGRFAFDTETTGLDPMRVSLVGISIALSAGESCYIPVGHTANLLETPHQLETAAVIERLRPVLEDDAIEKIAHNGKYDVVVLANAGVWVHNLTFDTMIAAYLLGEKTLGLKPLTFDRLNIKMTAIQELIGSGAKQISMAEVRIADAAPYAAADADMTLRLREVFERELHARGLWELFAEVEMPLVSVLTRMELTGVAIDVAVLREQSRALGIDMQRHEQEFYEAIGHQININSNKQLSSVLFEELHLPKTRKTTQGFSTDAQSLEALRTAHPAIEPLLEYRQLAKLKSTYLDALPVLIDPRDGRVHTNFNQCGAATGRLSSSDPNLQNIPVRTELGRDVRRAFVARIDGAGVEARLLSADYSQIELRILAHVTQEPRLVEAFRHDEDIHNATGADLFGVPLDQVTPDMRQVAKTTNFGTIYGLSAQGLAQRTGRSTREAAEFIKQYFERYPGIDRYLRETVAKVRQEGFAETLLGRRRYIADINSTNFNLRAAAERMATNHPIQGTNADIIKIAMNRIQAEIERLGLISRMIIQVHDELIFECPIAELDTVARLIHAIMPASIELSVPVRVDLKAGVNWGDLKPYAVGEPAPAGARGEL